MGNENLEFLPDDPQPGPTWQRADWPLVGGDAEDDLTQALDPTSLKAQIAEAAGKPGSPIDETRVEQAAADSIQAMMMIRTYRSRGHLAANLDPLGLHHSDLPIDLTPEFHGFTEDKLDTPVYIGGALGLDWVSVRMLVPILKANYCGNVGFEYMHIADVEERRWLQERIEGADKTIDFTLMGKKAILSAVVRGEEYEGYLGRKYVGTKRFGLDGGELMIPALESIIKQGGRLGVKEIVYGMAHRGRLNVLANVMAKPYKVIFHEFSGGSANPDDVGGSGDVKYHLGTSTDREFDGITVHMSLVPNPSHLETVDPVVLGKVRATLQMRDDLKEMDEVLPILIHGDAAFAGQGIIWETLGFQGIRGYATGGCIHFIINNQIGFTTSPQFARNSPYPSDVAKAVQAPIFHVNGDDPEAVTFCCKMAIEYRQKFDKDVVIDMWCYRRFGHNEGDEPSFTQPLMYDAIRNHAKVSEIYARRLVEQGVIEADFLEVCRGEFIATLDEHFEASKSYQPNEADWFAGRWSGFNKPVDPETARRNVPTGIEAKLFDSLGRTLTTVPADLEIHKTLTRVVDAKRKMFEDGKGFDWATGEALGFGSLLSEGYSVRLSGQDSGAALSASATRCGSTSATSTATSRSPACRTAGSRSTTARYRNTACSASNTVSPWPIPRRWCCGKRSSAISPTARRSSSTSISRLPKRSGCVPTASSCLLPHGYEGQGPEHSSARLERFLQLCAQDNIQVCNITTPANYFHVLRRQMHRSFRKPLIIMTPKSLLRHPMAKSATSDFVGDGHFMRILSDPSPPEDKKVRRLVLCSGKVAYDLIEARDAAGLTDVAIVRLEQLYPFPGEPLTQRLSKMTGLKEVVWCQEEPRNNGAWFFVGAQIEDALERAGRKLGRVRYAGRDASASPATGLAIHHKQQQEALVADALGLGESKKS